MPGVLGYGWHESNRGEYLAQFCLSALGVSAPVIRQEDIGVDFFCSLAKEENRRLTFHSPFMVQHGAKDSKEFSYGGFEKETKKWRQDQIEWLFSQELPLFLCVTDREKAECKLYSTSVMWLLRYQFGRMASVVLCPDETHDPLRDSRREKIGEGGDGYEYHVPLGRPIVDIHILTLDKNTRSAAIECLRKAVNVEQRNITMRRLGVHVSSWFTDIVPNEPKSLDNLGSGVSWDGTDGKYAAQQLDSMKDIAITLALNLQAEGKDEEITILAPVFRFYRRAQIPPWSFDHLPKLAIDNLR